ncbi:MAG: hypothetical protein ACI8VT_003066 [Saprospiraceae bacterium]|jgi:hypothetical protein
MKKHSIILLLSFFFITSRSSAQIYINEWMSSNSSTIVDPDFDETGDWIEIFNDYNTELDLSGYFLSDNLKNPAKWRFPQNTIVAANDFLLVWADGAETGLHTNFKLSKEGEEIALSNPDTLLLDSIIFSFQQTDVSMGRASDGALDIGFFIAPTPGNSNNTQVSDGLTFYQTHFSIKGGFFSTPIEVDLSTIDGTIRYTLDGSFPTVNSPEYTSPIPIAATTNLRARVFQPNYIPGKTITHTYFFNENFEERALPVISIATNPEYFWDTDIGLYVQDFKPDWEYPINIEIFENDGNNRAAINELAGTKINGQNSWVLPQKMLGIYFDNEYDNNNIDYPLFFDRDRRKYDNFILRASGSDWSSTLFRDGLCQGLTSETMGIEKSGFRPGIVYVNGEYMGIHNLRSRTDEGFIEENFGLVSNAYDLIGNNGDIEEGDELAFNELYSLFDQDLADNANYQAVTDLIDVQNFTDFFISEIWTSNSSWGHNQKIWKPKSVGGKWRWIMVDFDRGFSGSTNNGIDYFTSDNSPSGYDWARVPLDHMLENEEYALQFASRFADHLYTTFHPDQVTKTILERRTAIEAEVPYHVSRWTGTTSSYGDGIPTVEFWENEVQKLITFTQERGGFMIDDLQSHFGLEEVVNLGAMTYPNDAGHININGIKIPGSPWNGSYFKNLPFELSAVAGVGHQFEGWSAATFETIIEKNAEWKYLDDGSNQGSIWNTPAFDDNNWIAGLAELGYGDGDENTVLSYGPTSGDKYTTTYFRKTFTIDNVADYSGLLTFNLLRDDGAIVYLNGQELFRSNMPASDITFESYASVAVAGSAESTYNTFSIQTDQLVAGENVIAVEIHQSDATSSDISFDLEIKALKLGQGAIFFMDKNLPVNLSADTFYIANFLPTGECLLPRVISQNTTLTIACSPYLAPGDVQVLENVSLVVEAGVEIHFAQNASLTINGDLQVEGTEDKPVIFKAIEGDEKWGNLNFQFPTDTSRVAWLEIIDASKGDHPIHEQAAISAFYANVFFNHIKIDDVFGNPIFAEYSNISLINSQLYSKITGDLINVKYGYGFIENCDFRGNDQLDTDAIDFDEVHNGVIRNNKIHDFYGFNSDGIDLGEASSDVLIENNFIHNITDKAISVGQLSSVVAEHNTIVNCNQGFGIKDLSTAEIDQNTFYNTANPIVCYEKNIGLGGGVAFVSNSIFSNSPVIPFSVDAQSTINISNSLSDTEIIPGAGNLLDNPRFENPTQQDFILLSNSPAIGTGIDESGNTIDMGAKFFDFSAPSSIQISAIQYRPALNEEAEFLQIYNAGTALVDLTGYVFSDAIDFVFPPVQIAPNETMWITKDSTLFPDVTEQIFTWTRGKLSNDEETIRLTDAYGIIVDQVTYLDSLPWPVEADGLGDWLVLISPDLDNHFAESWMSSSLVSIEEPSILMTDFQIFPNPANDFVHIQSEEVLIEKVELYNLLGQKMIQVNVDQLKQVAFNLNEFANGIYMLKINGMLVAKKLLLLR